MTGQARTCSRALARASVLLAAVWSSPAIADDAPEVRIDARDGVVVVESDADTATILIGDRTRGVVTPGTRLTISLPEGTHRIAIEVAGHQRYERTIALQRGQTASLRATLAELTPRPAIAPSTGIEPTSPYGPPPARIEPTSPYGPPPARIEPTSPYGPPPTKIELMSPYGPPTTKIEPMSPYGRPTTRIELTSPYGSPPTELAPGAPASPDRRPGSPAPGARPGPGR